MKIIIMYWNPQGVKVERQFDDITFCFEVASELFDQGVSFDISYSAV